MAKKGTKKVKVSGYTRYNTLIDNEDFPLRDELSRTHVKSHIRHIRKK